MKSSLNWKPIVGSSCCFHTTKGSSYNAGLASTCQLHSIANHQAEFESQFNQTFGLCGKWNANCTLLLCITLIICLAHLIDQIEMLASLRLSMLRWADRNCELLKAAMYADKYTYCTYCMWENVTCLFTTSNRYIFSDGKPFVAVRYVCDLQLHLHPRWKL